MTEFYIIRHGQTTANQMGLKQGTINDERTYLSTAGQRQAEELASHFHPDGLAALYVSPLYRTRQTAAIVNRQLNLPVTIDKRLLEISYGDWDGQQNALLKEKHPDLFYPLIDDVRPEYAPVAHGETFQQVQKRVASFTREVVAAHPDEQVLVVSHGFTVRSFAANATGTAKFEILEPDNCSVSKIIVEPHSLAQHLIYYNRVATNRF